MTSTILNNVYSAITTSGDEVVNGMNDSAIEVATAAENAQAIANGLFTANNIWMMLATALVFIMHLGFAGFEAGFG